jgi:hypothetical protein
MLEFDAEVVLPAIVDRGIGNTVGTELGGECDAGAIERKRVVGNGNSLDGHDKDQQTICKWKAQMDLLLVVTHKTKCCDHQQWQQIAIPESA